ncbi:MAG: glycosyltransferase family 9 protein [Gemmatimonadales bacterium]
MRRSTPRDGPGKCRVRHWRHAGDPDRLPGRRRPHDRPPRRARRPPRPGGRARHPSRRGAARDPSGRSHGHRLRQERPRRGWTGWKRTADRLRAATYHRAYLPHQSVRSAALARWARIPERIGFAGAAGAFWYTKKVPRPKEGHEAERLLALADSPPDAEARIHLELTEDDRAAAYAWLATKGVGDGFVAMAPGSIWGTKRWGGYGDLARLLPGRIVLLGGPADHAAAQAVVDAAPDRVVDATGELPLRVSAAVLERARVLVTNDSAPLHLASATQTPTVAVFGPTVPAFGFGPRAAQAAIVERALPCRPCSAHGPERCPLGHHRCMREIPAAAVRDAINQLIR